jgi:RND family efflux transporter MFP subunit
MFLRKALGFLLTMVIFTVAVAGGRVLWFHYMDEPWTRDGRVHADVIDVAPDVSGAVVAMPVIDNQFVHKGDLIMLIDPSHYRIAVAQAEATVAQRKTELRMLRDDAKRRADMDSEVVSRETRDNSARTAAAGAAQLQQAEAALEASRLNLERTRVLAPVDGYITNLNTYRGDYAIAGSARLAIIDSHSFWVYGYFEETKLRYVHVGDHAEMALMSGGTLSGHVESVSRGIYDRDNPESQDLLADVNPIFNWVRLAQRVPVRIHIDEMPQGILLAAGMTCTVTVTRHT